MARKATDLLDVFRFSNEDGNDDQERKKRRKAKRAAARASGGGRSGRGGKRKAGGGRGPGRKPQAEGIHLTQRHLVLASCAIVLLLVLSFTLGLATGRPGAADRAGPTLQRETLVAIRATLPLIDPASRKQLDPVRIRSKLAHEYRLKPANLRIWKEDGRVVLEVGPFRSRSLAEAYLRRSGLEMAHISMEDPFRWPEYVAWQP